MKRRIYLLAGVSLTLLLFTSTLLTAGELKRITLKVEGMTCAFCAPSVKYALERVPGVKKAEAKYKEKEAIVVYEDGKVKIDDLVKAVENTGFKAKVKEKP